MRERFEKPKRFIDAQFLKLEEHEDCNRQLINQSYFLSGPNKMEETPNPTTLPHQKNINECHEDVENSFQISFEAGFMEEHQMCLRKQAENLMESYLKQKDYIHLGFAAIKNLQYMNFQPKALTPAQSYQLQNETRNKQKFAEFLQLIRNTLQVEVASELLFISYWAWKSYSKINDPFISQIQLIENAEKYGRKDSQILFKESGLKFLNLAVAEKSQLNPEQQMRRGFCQFVVFVYTTIFLIMEGYFENPYSENERKGKRMRNEEQIINQTEQDSWGMNYYPTKKIYYL